MHGVCSSPASRMLFGLSTHTDLQKAFTTPTLAPVERPKLLGHLGAPCNCDFRIPKFLLIAADWSLCAKIITNVTTIESRLTVILVPDMREHFVIDPLISKRQQLLLATQLCRMVLKVRCVFIFVHVVIPTSHPWCRIHIFHSAFSIAYSRCGPQFFYSPFYRTWRFSHSPYLFYLCHLVTPSRLSTLPCSSLAGHLRMPTPPWRWVSDGG